MANSPQLKNGMVTGVVADSVFARYFTSYASGGDPVEVSLYYEVYRRGDYRAVIGAKEKDYQVMGAGLKRARSIALEIANSSSRYKDQARRLAGEPGL